MIYIDVLPKPILYLSKLLHKQNIEKINRSFVLGFDKILAKKYPQIVKIFSV